jgi:hypothetical protein
VSGENGVGITNGFGVGSQYLGQDTNSIGYFSAGEVCSPLDLPCATVLSSWTMGARIGTKIDLDAHTISFTLDGTNYSQNFDISMITGPVMFANEADPTGGSMTVNFGPTFTYPVPTGFGAW